MPIILKPENLAQLVFFVRNEKVMLDTDLAMLYGVRTKALNQALFRNKGRFPEDFAFQLTKEEFDLLRSQIVTSKGRRGGRVTNLTPSPSKALPCSPVCCAVSAR